MLGHRSRHSVRYWQRPASALQPVRRLDLKRHWPALAILACGALLVSLAALQFVWTGQLSEAQRDSMRTALANSVRQFEQELQRELEWLLRAFQADLRPGAPASWERYGERYDLWLQLTAHPQLLRRLVIYEPSRGAEAWMELPLGVGAPARVIPAEQVYELGRAIADRRTTRREGGAVRSLFWTLVPSAQALVRPELTVEEGRRGERAPRIVRRGQLILMLDWDYIAGTMVPAMVDRFFAGADGERLYEVAVVAQGSQRFLYRSDPGSDGRWLREADIRRRMRLYREIPAQPQAGPDRRDGAATGPEARPGPRPVREMLVPGLRLRSAAWERVVPIATEGRLDVLVAAKHVFGSLDEAVAQQRRSNLTVGFGVLLLLAGALVLVVVATRRAAQLTAMQIEFVAGVTHELRTPLAVICSVGENLADGVVGEASQVRRYGQLIRDQGRRLAEMVEQSLQFAALESGKRKFHVMPLDTAQAVDSALQQARPMIDEAGLTVEREDGRGLPLALADAKALQQALSNLLSNAAKYAKSGRWLRVETAAESSPSGREIQIRIRDRGPGIASHEAARVFDAFYRGAAASDGQVQGSGLGLKLARDLVRGMGGDLSVRSDPAGGSVFTVHLLVQAEAEA